MSRAGVAPDPTGLGSDAFANVIVPLGASASGELALAPALELARLLGARLVLLSVGVEEAEATEMARRLTILARGFGGTVETRVDYDVAGAILAVTRENDPALVCMASHGRGRLGYAVCPRVAFGSVASAVVRSSPVPVLAVAPAAS